MNLENGIFSISLPSWEWWQYAIIANVIYGFATHFHSLKQIKQWNATPYREREALYNKTVYNRDRLIIGPGALVFMMFYRISIQFPIRVLCFALGGFIIFCECISAGILRFNPIFKSGWNWHCSPLEIVTEFNTW